MLTTEVAEAFFAAIREQAEAHELLSCEHFSLDGTLIEAAAALKSLRPLEEDADEEPQAAGGGRNQSVDFHGQRRGNETDRSATDPDARLARKGRGKEARLCYAGHTLVENRNGFIVAAELTQASDTAEREAGLRLLGKERRRRRRHGRLSIRADKGYDTAGFVAGVRALGVTPHVARKRRFSALDGRTTRHASYAVSQRRRKIVEEPFGWMKVIGGLHKLRHRGEVKVAAIFTFTAAAFNLVRLRTLLAEPSPADVAQQTYSGFMYPLEVVLADHDETPLLKANSPVEIPRPPCAPPFPRERGRYELAISALHVSVCECRDA